MLGFFRWWSCRVSHPGPLGNMIFVYKFRSIWKFYNARWTKNRPKKSPYVTQKKSASQAASLRRASDINITPAMIVCRHNQRMVELVSYNWRKGRCAECTSEASEDALNFACKCVCSYCMRVVQMRLAEYLVKFQSSKAYFSPNPTL